MRHNNNDLGLVVNNEDDLGNDNFDEIEQHNYNQEVNGDRGMNYDIDNSQQ